MIGPVESVFPTSVGGWVGLIAGTTALALLIVDRLTARGKNLATIDRKIDGLCGQVTEMEGELKAVGRRITVIERRNDRIDWIREEDERRSGGKHRRAMDEELGRILPEKREDKP